MKTILFAVVLACAAVAGCHPHATLSAPAGFGRVDGSYDYRAASPSGVVVAVRAEPNKPRADLAFWTAAVDVALGRKGYVRRDSSPVKSRGGASGVLMKYDTGAGAAYWIAVFDRGDTLLVAEATGAIEDIEAASTDVTSSLLSARLD